MTSTVELEINSSNVRYKFLALKSRLKLCNSGEVTSSVTFEACRTIILILLPCISSTAPLSKMRNVLFGITANCGSAFKAFKSDDVRLNSATAVKFLIGVDRLSRIAAGEVAL